MNLFFDSQIFSWQIHGGISRYFVELGRRLALRDDINFRIISPFYVNRFLGADKTIPITGILLPKLPYTVTVFKIINRILTLGYLYCHTPDIVHETFYTVKPVAPPSTRIVITIHDLIHEKFPTLYAHQQHVVAAKAAAVQRADHIICVSHHTKKDLCEIYNVPSEKISVIYHGVSLPQGSLPALPTAVKKPYILYVGDRGEHKNFSFLVEAVASTPDIHGEVMLVCFGGPPFNAEEMRLMADCGVPPGTIQWLHGDDRLLQTLYRNAVCLICPSLYEGFGLPLVEAMAVGCPVLCSNTGALPEIGGDAAVYFDPTDRDDAAQALQHLINSPTLRQKMSRAGLARSRWFSWDNCFRNTLKIYQRLYTEMREAQR